MNAQKMDVLAQVRSWLPFDGDDDNIRQKFDDHCAAVAELIDANKELLAAEPAHMTPRNAREREAYKAIRAVMAKIGDAA